MHSLNFQPRLASMICVRFAKCEWCVRVLSLQFLNFNELPIQRISHLTSQRFGFTPFHSVRIDVAFYVGAISCQAAIWLQFKPKRRKRGRNLVEADGPDKKRCTGGENQSNQIVQWQHLYRYSHHTHKI